MNDQFRQFDDLTDLIIKHKARRSRRSLFSEEKAQQWLLGDAGPLLDQNIGMDDLDPAFPDYNVAGLFNAYFRDGDPEDNTLDYWTIQNGAEEITVEQCAQSPGGICVVYTADGEVSVSLASYLISGAAPAAIGVDYGVIIALGNFTTGVMRAQASLTWYDEAGNEITTTYGQVKTVEGTYLKWLKIPRSKGAQRASFVSMKIQFHSTGVGYVQVYGVKLFELLPAEDNPGDPGSTPTAEPVTVVSPQQAMGLYTYDDFERSLVTIDGFNRADSSDIGDTPDGHTWDVSSAFYGDTVEISGNQLVLTQGAAYAHRQLYIYGTSEGDAALPLEGLDEWVLRMRFRVRGQTAPTAGDQSIRLNYNENTIALLQLNHPSSGTTLKVFGDTVDEIVSVSHPTLDTYYYLALRWVDGQASTKLWEASGAEPDWGTAVDVASVGSTDRIQLAFNFGAASGAPMSVEVDQLEYSAIDLSANIGNILAGTVTGAPWEGDTEWLTDEAVGFGGDDGLPALEGGAARFVGDGTIQYLSAYQIGSTWERSTLTEPTVIAESSDVTETDYSGGVTTYDLHLPDGCDVPGRHLIAYLNADPYDDMYDTMIAAGWTKLLFTSGSTFFWKRLGGADGDAATGYTGSDDTDEITIDDHPGGEPPGYEYPIGTKPVLTAVVLLVEGLYDEGASNPGPWTSSSTSSDEDPNDISDPGWSEGILWITGLRQRYAPTVVNEGPEDYNFGDEDEEEQAVSPAFGVLTRMDYRSAEATADEDPGAYDTDSDMAGFREGVTTIALRGGGLDIDGGYVATTAKPEGPHNVPHIAVFKCRFTDGTDGAYFQYDWYGSQIEGVDKGGGFKVVKTVAGTFLNLQGQAQFAITDWTLGDWYYVMVDMTGVVQKVRVWKEGDVMPATWDSTYALSGGNSGFAYLAMDGSFDDGFEVDTIWIGLGPEEGLSGRVYIGFADGSTTTYYSPLPWGSGGPKVYVDGFLTVLKSYDASDWSFVFDRAPSYGAKIEVEV